MAGVYICKNENNAIKVMFKNKLLLLTRNALLLLYVTSCRLNVTFFGCIRSFFNSEEWKFEKEWCFEGNKLITSQFKVCINRLV
tara:strand:- start:7975 stop:8226 length:252 start_codon:yes stop_codon:yes gene_type:complete